MCGIYGYIGEHSAGQIIVKGLRSLEYRGYDSAGIAVIDNVGNINISKFGEHKSSIDKLTKSIKDDKFNGNIGIVFGKHISCLKLSSIKFFLIMKTTMSLVFF